jgi:hypothetical protein
MADQKVLQKRNKEDQCQVERLEQELRLKDKALAERATLLIASKKIQAYLGEEEGDCPQRRITARPLRSPEAPWWILLGAESWPLGLA